MFALSVQAQTQVTPPATFTPAVEVACPPDIAWNQPQFAPPVPDTQTPVTMTIVTDNLPIYDYAVATNGLVKTVFLVAASTIEPFPYVPMLRCYSIPLGLGQVGTYQVSFLISIRYFSGQQTQFIPISVLPTRSFDVIQYVPQKVQTGGVYLLVALCGLLGFLGRKKIAASKYHGLGLVLIFAPPPPIALS